MRVWIWGLIVFWVVVVLSCYALAGQTIASRVHIGCYDNPKAIALQAGTLTTVQVLHGDSVLAFYEDGSYLALQLQGTALCVVSSGIAADWE